MRAASTLLMLLVASVLATGEGAASATGDGGAAGEAATDSLTTPEFAAARRRARAAGKLVLLEFGTEWCAPCKAFLRDMRGVPVLQQALSAIVFVELDAEKGEGSLLAKDFRVEGFPTFVLTSPAGDPVDRMMGYTGPAAFAARLASALDDPTTIEEKTARLQRAPTAALAARLAEIRVSESNLQAGVELYRRARSLDPGAPGGYAAEIFAAVEMGYLVGFPGFEADSLEAAAGDVLAANAGEAAPLLRVAATMRLMAEREQDRPRAAPYLAAAVSAAADVAEPALLEQRRALLPDHALYVERDVRKAVRLHRQAQPQGWRDDAAKLGAFARWCFDRDIDLKAAERLARRGVRLAAPGRAKASVLDTLAEIRARRGDPGEAARLSEQAAHEEPGNDHHTKQVRRFREMAEQVRSPAR